MNLPNAFVALLLAAFASAAFADPACLTKNPAENDPSTPLTYPMTSNRYAVQYRLDGGDWEDAKVYISYYGGTNASPLLTYTIVGYTLETSMSFVSIPVHADANVQIRVTKLWDAPFLASDQVSVRPAAKKIDADLMSDGTVEISTRTGDDFAGEQFILWWDRGVESGGIEGLAFFLDPSYDRPRGDNVKTVSKPEDLEGDLSNFDTLDFEGTVAVGGAGHWAFTVPPNIANIFLAPGSWVQGKLHFQQDGTGNSRRIYGPGVLDGSRFSYNLRFCRTIDTTDPTDPEDIHLPDQGLSALSFEGPPANSPGILDQFVFDGIVVSDYNYYGTDYLNSTTVNNLKTISWNGNNDGLMFGTIATASNVFVRSGDDSLKMWGSFTTVTNATVWQTWNGGVVNLGWFDNSPGENSLIDGLYVVKMDWQVPANYDWHADTLKGQQDGQNDAVIASMMIPGTKFGSLHPSTYRNIYIDDTPNVLFSLKILPHDCGLDALTGQPCKTQDLTRPGVLNLNLEHVFTPASKLDQASTVGNSIGFQYVAEPPINGAALTGSMNINLTDVEVIPNGGGRPIVLTSANAGSVGNVVPNGNNVNLEYADRPQPPSGPQWYSAWTAPQIDRIATSLSGHSVRMIVRPTLSGSAVRVKIENVVGIEPVTFSAAYIGKVQSGAALVPGSSTQLTFSGLPGLTLDAGKGVYSDPVTFPISAFTRYAVSLDVTTSSDISGHEYGLVTNYVAAGAHAADPSGSGFTPIPNAGFAYPVYWVAAVDVASMSSTGTVVALGDSITDGFCSDLTNGGTGTVIPDLYNRWTDLLAARFAALPADQSKAVANEGIAGNNVTVGFRPALFRMADDVLGREGATHVIFLEGTNDLHAGKTAAQLTAADQRIVADAHQIGLKIIGATILPRGGDPFWTAGMEKERLELNEWIRQGGYFDGVIDFDALMQGPPGMNHLVSIPEKWSCHDGVHPNSAGYAAMAAFIDLDLFRTRD
jgi:lysophospholipase L1-like esterase